MLHVKTFIFIISITAHLSVLAQFENTYYPKKPYSQESKELLDRVDEQMKKEVLTFDNYKSQRILKSNTKNLVNQIKSEQFLNDDTLEAYVSKVFTTILEANGIDSAGKTILVKRDYAPNAICLGEGTFYVTVGLLRKMKNESELAFTLGHEIAHYQLNHVKNRIEELTNSKVNKEIRSEVEKILFGDISIEGMDRLKELVYDQNDNSRQLELEADSLGFIFGKKARYHDEGAITLIDQLDVDNFSNYNKGARLFKSFHFKLYPFQASWLKDRLSIYSKEYNKAFIFDVDSIQSHPEYSLRKEKIKTYIDSLRPSNDEPISDDRFELISKTAELEAIECAMFQKRFDIALFLGLEMKHVYPNNVYVNTTIAKLLLKLYEAKRDGLVRFIIPDFTQNYSDELRMVNHFMHNIDKEELIELAFHFLSQKSNFNSANENHYYMLWQFADYTERESIKQQLFKMYSDKYPEGEYIKKMKKA